MPLRTFDPDEDRQLYATIVDGLDQLIEGFYNRLREERDGKPE